MNKKKSNLSLLLEIEKEKETNEEKKAKKEKQKKQDEEANEQQKVINSYSSEEDFEEQQNIRVYNLDNLRIHRISNKHNFKDIYSLESILHSFFNEKHFDEERKKRYKNDFNNYFNNVLVKFRPDIIKKEVSITKKKNEAKSEPIIIPSTSVDTPDRKTNRNQAITKLSKNTKKKLSIPFPKMDKGGAKTKRKNMSYKFSKKKNIYKKMKGKKKSTKLKKSRKLKNN